MPAPEDKGAILSAIDDHVDFHVDKAKAESAAEIEELRATVHDRDVTINDQREQIQTRDEEIGRLGSVVAELKEALRACQEGEEPEEPDPEGPSTEERIQGTWVLQQVSTADELRRLRPQIEAALSLDGVVGFCVRFPWDRCDLTGSTTTHPLLDLAYEIAHGKGRELSIRFMAGEHTPTRVFDAGASWMANGSDKAPVPWDNSSGSVQVFLDAYDAYVGKLAAWCRSHGVDLLHGSWFALDWAELNHGKEIRAVEGYTKAKWLDGHKRLIDVLAAHSDETLAVELPLSGYGPVAEDMSPALADHIISIISADENRFFIQANGLGEVMQWGAPTSTVEAQFDRIWAKAIDRGMQMIQPQDYDWAKVYGEVKRDRATYVEVYLPSFRLANASQLRQQIAAFHNEEN